MAEPVPLDLVSIRLLGPADWQAYRSVRLEMLRESPMAFGTTYAEAVAFAEAAWLQRLRDNAVFLARVADVPAGSATYSELFAEFPGDAGLMGMWVAPEHRGTCVGRMLVERVMEQARSRRRRRLLLDVVASNDRARRLYERCGFVATGRTAPHPGDGAALEVEMAVLLDSTPPASRRDRL